jgi:hypothetical protein
MDPLKYHAFHAARLYASRVCRATGDNKGEKQ